MPDTETLPRLLTIKQAAEHLGVTERHMRRLVAERRLPYLKVGRYVRFDSADLVRWLDDARQPEADYLPARSRGFNA